MAKNSAILIVATGMALVAGYLIIPILRKIKLGQYVREEGPQSHLQKAGTPTMGGFIFLSPLIMIGLFFNHPVFWLTLACAGIGFVDDYIKVVLKRSLGLRAYQKILLQLVVIGAYIGYQYSQGMDTEIIIPFSGMRTWDMGLWWVPFVVVVVLGTMNGANLTDGLDGLSGSVTGTMLIFFLYVSSGPQNINLFSLTLVLLGGLLGFLWFNAHPAKVFMGDTGSLALGGFVAFFALELKMPLFILLFGIIYLVESLSVMIQVAYFKKTGKRIFKMTPIHHHFELSGLSEKRIVMLFTLITMLGVALSIIALLGADISAL